MSDFEKKHQYLLNIVCCHMGSQYRHFWQVKCSPKNIFGAILLMPKLKLLEKYLYQVPFCLFRSFTIESPNKNVSEVEFQAMKHWFSWTVNQLPFLQWLQGVKAVTNFPRWLKPRKIADLEQEVEQLINLN